ncbi:hypothetical protein Pmani_009932 [Petrolisthes manimaculis]|uniref:Uncharacterized protein n=1 Tax=Petrolisthes manimaculis TaxID=1843537 RepID=A0AAE1UHV6_9EUCA|nr:hypothetical protein Pmani_009932 [Petrolisthes manimaculis]
MENVCSEEDMSLVNEGNFEEIIRILQSGKENAHLNFPAWSGFELSREQVIFKNGKKLPRDTNTIYSAITGLESNTDSCVIWEARGILQLRDCNNHELPVLCVSSGAHCSLYGIGSADGNSEINPS